MDDAILIFRYSPYASIETRPTEIVVDRPKLY